MNVTIRRLVESDHATLRRVRLGALQVDPDAFGSTYERENAFDEARWRGRLHPDGNPHFGAFVDEEMVGIVAVGRDDDEPERVAWLLSMWVDSSARRRGIGHLLVDRALDCARDRGVATVLLEVTEGNPPAEALYRRHGFVRTEHVAIRDRDGRREVVMELRLDEER